MAKILSNFKQAFIDEVKDAIAANTSSYYAFAAHPIPYVSGTPVVDDSVYESKFLNDWTMILGKELVTTDLAMMVNNYVWTSNTVYTRYDNTSNTMPNSQYYAITPPVLAGGNFHVFKCIDNANGTVSTDIPDQIQTATFTKTDGYMWRYICTTTAAEFVKFGTDHYFPIIANTIQQTSAYSKSGVDVVVIANTGSGYDCHHDGIVRAVVNTTVIQVENDASTDPGFYDNGGIYIYNTISSTSQLKVIDSYVSNLAGNFVYLTAEANTTNITPGITGYKIAPQIAIDTDGDEPPLAYCTVNTTSNSIGNVTIIDTGYGVTRASCEVVSNTAYGSGANLYAIAPPPGGHAHDPASELNLQGVGMSFSFANTEGGTIPHEITYNKIGILKNPYILEANNTKGAIYSANTFDSLLYGTISPAATFTAGELVTGNTSGAVGVVAYANTSEVYLTGDKDFTSGEYIVSANGLQSSVLTVTALGDIYTKDIQPIYVQNIDNLARANTQTETFKIIIQV